MIYCIDCSFTDEEYEFQRSLDNFLIVQMVCASLAQFLRSTPPFYPAIQTGSTAVISHSSLTHRHHSIMDFCGLIFTSTFLLHTTTRCIWYPVWAPSALVFQNEKPGMFPLHSRFSTIGCRICQIP